MLKLSRHSLPVAGTLLLAGALYACSGMHHDSARAEADEHGEKAHEHGKEAHEADEESGGEEEDEQVVTLEATPMAVRDAFARLAPATSVKKVERLTDEGAVRYEIEFLADGIEQSATFSEGGQLIELEREMPVDKLPAAVQAALSHDFPGGTLSKAESVQLSFYEVQVTSAGRKHDVKVYATGDIED